MIKHVIDASRAGEVLDEFLRLWKFELTDEIAGIVLNFRLNREVDALCRRLADNPNVPIDKVTVALRALLAGRVLLFLANSVEEPDAEILAGEGPWSDEAIRAGVCSTRQGPAAEQVGWEAVRSGVELTAYSVPPRYSPWCNSQFSQPLGDERVL